MTAHDVRNWTTAFLHTLAVAALASCGTNNPDIPDALVVVEGARRVQYESQEGQSAVSYELTQAYPATATLTEIKGTLALLGWSALGEDIFNPGTASSHVDGWSSFADATVRPEVHVDQWLAQWEDDAGNIAFYTVRYRAPNSNPAARSDVLEVSAAIIPVEAVRAFQQFLEQQ
jgi:hypothetical protein